MSKRETLITECAQTTRHFMTYAVLFQDAVARAVGLNSTDLMALGVLAEQGPSSPGVLAQRTGMTPGGAVTLLIDRLEAAGFVQRSRDQQDRRRVLVTADLQQIEEQIGPLYAAVQQRWDAYLETLTIEQLNTCLQFLRTALDINRGLTAETGRTG